MSVQLIAVTQPVPATQLVDAEDLVAFCARVSNPANQANKETAGKLPITTGRRLRWCRW
jgi:hypothetical protein